MVARLPGFLKPFLFVLRIYPSAALGDRFATFPLRPTFDTPGTDDYVTTIRAKRCCWPRRSPQLIGSARPESAAHRVSST
jgi:hypothetical protein